MFQPLKTLNKNKLISRPCLTFHFHDLSLEMGDFVQFSFILFSIVICMGAHISKHNVIRLCNKRKGNNNQQPANYWQKFRPWLWGFFSVPGSQIDCCCCCWGGLTSLQKLFSSGKTPQTAGKEPNPGLLETDSTTVPICSLTTTPQQIFHTTNDHPVMYSDRKSHNM